MGADNTDWAFSAAAQALAAIVAFLLAGYALVSSMMDSLTRADETLNEVNEELKRRYHRWLGILVSATAPAVLVDLLVVYLNGGTGAPCPLQLLGAALTAGSVVGAVLFVITSVDPKKHEKTARQMVAASTLLPPKTPGTEATAFFSEFVRIEKLVRSLWESKTDARRLSRRPEDTSEGSNGGTAPLRSLAFRTSR